jgi:hypothetical protein
MRILRFSWLAGALLGVACQHDEIVNLVGRDGATSIPSIDLTTAQAGGFLGGTRAINRFLYASFDTGVVDAFGRATTNPPYFRADPNPFYGTTNLIYAPNAAVATFTPPVRLLPALTDTARVVSFYGSGPNAIGYIVPGNHPGNGSTPVWEVWFDFDQLAPNTRYVLGLARYQLQVNGALDWAELLQTGSVTQPDMLVFPAGNTPGGKKRDGVYTTNCASANIIQPIAGANPHLVGGGTTDGTGAVEIDQTICSNASSAWFNGLGDARSPVPKNNNTPLGGNQYNFLVLWEALPDSTPNYAKPVFRLQIGPIMTTTGFVYNNTYGPFPTAQFTQSQLAAAPGGQAVADSLRVTGTTLFRTPSAVYSLWLVATSTGATAKVTGNVIRQAAGVAVDTLVGVSEFALTGTMDGASVLLRLGDYAAEPWNAAVLAVGPAGATSLPASQPLWTAQIQKVPGSAAPALSASLVFGSFNGGSGTLAFGANGAGTGGIFGAELREDIRRLARPPVGFFYEAWLINTSDPTVAPANLGPLLAPYPALTSLYDADVMTGPPLAGVELVQAALLFVASGYDFYCDYDRLDVRLQSKNGPGTIPPTIVLRGTNPRTGC